MRFADFTFSDIEHYKTRCNFTPSEMICFDLKTKDCTNTQIALELNVSESTVAVIMKRIRSKVNKEMDREKKVWIDFLEDKIYRKFANEAEKAQK